MPHLRVFIPILLLTFAACNFVTKVCTLVGCDSGLTVTVANAPPGPVTVRARDAAATTPVSAECTGGSLCTVRFEDFTPKRVTVEVTAGATTRSFTVTPAYTVAQPNGPTCGTCRNSAIAIGW